MAALALREICEYIKERIKTVDRDRRLCAHSAQDRNYYSTVMIELSDIHDHIEEILASNGMDMADVMACFPADETPNDAQITDGPQANSIIKVVSASMSMDARLLATFGHDD